MFVSDLRALHESYQGIYEEGDGISHEMLEEVVEELIQECVEFGYTLDEATVAVENAAILYIDEAKVTYGSDTESPEQRRERAKTKVGEKKAAARKAAVKGAVKRVKDTAMGVKAAAGIGASIAKDEARRAGRKAAHAVSSTVRKKKEEVKTGVKSLIGRGLRKAAGAVGKVAQKAAGAASRLGEEVQQLDEISDKKVQQVVNARNRRFARSVDSGAPNKEFHQAARSNKLAARRNQRTGSNVRTDSDIDGTRGIRSREETSRMREIKVKKEAFELDTWDVVLEYLITNGHADTNSEALYIMSQLDEEMVQSIIETRMDPRGRPASGPMNVYAKNKPNTDPAFQAALERVRAADAKKTPEQRKAELDAYKARQANK